MISQNYSPQLALEHIWGYLGELKIKRERAAQNMIRTFHTGIFGEIKIMIHAHENGVMVSVNPVVERPVDGWGPSVHRLVETLNRQAHMVKVGQDRDGDVFVKVELPPQEIVFAEFLSIFLSLCRISEDLLVPVWQAHVYDSFEKKAA